MAEKIVIEIDGKDNASATFKKVGMSVTDLNSAIEIATRVYDVAAQAFKMTVDEAQKYDQQIRDVMLSTGATAEESSRLVQVVDDAGVSYSTLKTAMKMASKEGIEPNIASLQSLSDQYLKLAPGVERNQFLLDKFGKSGLDMARVMELGGSTIAKMNAEIDGGLVLTQEAIDQSEEYRKNVDELSDAFQAFKVTIGNAVIPVINDSIDANKQYAEAMKRAEEATGSTDRRTNQWVASLILQSGTLNTNIVAVDSATASWIEMAEALSGKVTPAEEADAEAIKHMTEVNREYLDLVGSVTKEYESQSEKISNLSTEHEDLLAEKQKLIDEGWWAESEKVKEVNEKIDENREKYSEATNEFELNTRRRILSMLEEQLSLDGLSAEEQDILLAKGLAWGVYSQQAVDATKAAMQEVAALTDAINTIPSERTFTMSVLVQGADAVGGLGAGFGAEQWGGGKAVGGSVSAGTTYLVGERGPELFSPSSSGTIIPNNKMGAMGTDSRVIALLETIAAKPAINEYILGQVVKESISQVIR